MTNDTTALQERIGAEIIRSECGDNPVPPFVRERADRLVAAVLPIIAAEMQAAKAEALRVMQEHHEREADKAQTITARGIHLTIADGARNRATEYETGDQT